MGVGGLERGLWSGRGEGERKETGWWEGVCDGGEAGLALTYDGDTERRPTQQSSDSWRQLNGNYYPEVEKKKFLGGIFL